ncbi:MAG: hypothetical protein HY815_05220 [Candidatus Riflebacteria bacterium]|nr:hypothetical protein [Candidatus Riflebacteria bacterium]
MRHRIRIERAHPGEDRFDPEGRLDVVLSGLVLSCAVLMPTPEAWSRLAHGLELDVELWLERSGSVRRLPEAPAALTSMGGVFWRATGLVTDCDGDWLKLESVVPLSIDLDPPVQAPSGLPLIAAGDHLEVEGRLKLDLELD